MGRPRYQIEREAREAVQARLGLVTLVVWFVLAFSIALAMVTAGRGRAP